MTAVDESVVFLLRFGGNCHFPLWLFDKIFHVVLLEYNFQGHFATRLTRVPTASHCVHNELFVFVLHNWAGAVRTAALSFI